MLGSNGRPPKAPAPSIWSFDSGYESYDLYDAAEAKAAELIASEVDQDPYEVVAGPPTVTDSIEERRNNSPLSLGNFFNVRVGDQVRLQQDQPTINPVLTKLNVSSKSSSRTNSILIDQPVEDKSCLSCELWNTLEPGKTNQCTTCNPPRSPRPVRASKDVKPEASKLDIQKTERCSACELSALINPRNPSKCQTCTEAESKVAPPKLTVEVPSKIRRSRAGRSFKLPQIALDKLQQWLDAHHDNPYPSSDDKKQLAQECGITEKQVTTWFTNARARKLNPMESCSSGCSDDEGAPESAVTSVADATPFSAGLSPAIAQGAFQSTRSRAGSMSASSIISPVSPQARRQGGNRRGKKKNYRTKMQPPQLPTIPAVQANNNAHSGQESWQCTFCGKHLSPKSWRRHEETQHLPRVSWTCMLYGPRLSFSNHKGSCCAFCQEENPTEEHFLHHHRISECAARPLDDRTFYRPDHLRQHVKNYHGAPLYDMATTRWKRNKPRTGNWKCGFCSIDLDTWDQRETHIANHFRDGMTIAQWAGPSAVEDAHVHNELHAPEPIAHPMTPGPRMALSPFDTAMPIGSSSSNATSPMERQSPFAPSVPPLLHGEHSRNSSAASMPDHHSPFPQQGPFPPPMQQQPHSMPICQIGQQNPYAQPQPQGMLPPINFSTESFSQSCGNLFDDNNTQYDPTFTTADSIINMNAVDWSSIHAMPIGNNIDYDQFMNDEPNEWSASGP